MALSKQGDDDVIKEMTSAKSVKEDAAFLLAPYMSFEEFLVPAPISICVLGEVVYFRVSVRFCLDTGLLFESDRIPAGESSSSVIL